MVAESIDRSIKLSANTLMRALKTVQITEKAPKKNDIKHVLKLLDNKFKSYRNGTTKGLPGEPVGNVVKRTLQVGTLLDFLHLTDHPVIMTPSSGVATHMMTHNELHGFIKKSFNLAKFNLWRGDRVAICLPEGPSLNLCLLATMAYCTCVPSNSQLTPDELVNDYKYLKVKAVIVPYSKLSSDEGDNLMNTFRHAGLQVIGLKTTSDFDIQFTLVKDPIEVSKSPFEMTNNPSLNKANDVVMIFQTSGTTDQKKIVPYRLSTLSVSTTCVIFSLNAKHTDTIINMMPLFHVGGIIRNLLTPVFSGGTIIQCQGFDPVLFCDILENISNPIWFYGVPSMQQSIIQEASMRKLSCKCCSLVKKICNAGGGLSPSLAKTLKSIFTQAVVLPSYGMTECMPICAPPNDYGLEREGTSGQVIGPDVAISVDSQITREESITGHILVRGGPCFDGYEDVDQSDTFDKNGWFDTGDMGYLEDGYIYITGRSKEVINRGGVIISPLEIENVLITHPKVSQVMIFSASHETLQETIGCVVVVRDDHTRPDLRSLRKFLDKKLHSSKHPQLLVYMNDLPKNNVGKVLRINFSNRLGLPTICSSTEMLQSHQLYEARCAGKGASINELIPARMVEWSMDDVIETVKKHPQVKSCSAHRNADANKFILFVVKKNNNDEGLVRNIETHLQKHVHDYMLPTDIIIVQQDYFNLNGSMDNDKLEYLVKQQEKTTDDPVERVLCDIFGLAIGMPKDHEGNASQFPVDGNFFNYGGNSLKSGFLVSLIRRKLGVTLPTSTLYKENCQTPIGMAKMCREKMSPDHILLTFGYDKFQQEDGDDDHRPQKFKSSSYKERMTMRPESGAKNPFNLWTMLFQGSPLYLMYPLAFIVQWIFFVYMVALLSSAIHFRWNGFRGFLLVFLALIITWITSAIVFPIFGIIVKWLVIGRYKAGTYPLYGQYYLRWWFINKLLSVTNVGIFRINYKMYALYLRLMGAKIGKNSCVSYINNIQEFDLINIGSDCHVDNCTIRPFVLTRGHMNLKPIVVGDNCVLGLRSNIVAIEDGAMVADNCLVLPGAYIGRNAILGSGGLLRKHFSLPDESIWCGSYGGNAEKISSDVKPNEKLETFGHTIGYMTSPNATTISIENDTSRPFGRAFYERKASYFVLPLVFIIIYNCVFSFAGTILWTLPTLSALQATAAHIRSQHITLIDGGSASYNHSTIIIICVLFGAFSLFYVLTSILALSLEVILTLAIMGRRRQGSYNWDKNSYCQRWQVLIMIQKAVRRSGSVLTSLGGSAWIVLFFRSLGCKIGKRVCLYPNGSDPVMTEPDLVVLEDDVAVDRASLVCHLNTLGEFSINPLHVGAGSVLHNDSRLASGATMLEDCTLLDRSYIVPGEVVEANSVWKGYPAISTSIEEQYSLYAKKNLKLS